MKIFTVIFDMHGIIYEHDYSKDGDHNWVEINGALKVLLSYFNMGYKVVILSSSSTEHSRDVLEVLLNNYPQVDSTDFFKKIDILSMKYFGSKDDVDSWQHALEPYKNIEHIYEDGEQKLQTAGEAAKNLGHQPSLHLSIEN